MSHQHRDPNFALYGCLLPSLYPLPSGQTINIMMQTTLTSSPAVMLPHARARGNERATAQHTPPPSNQAKECAPAPEHTEMILMRSGGVRKNESGTRVSFFIRQARDSFVDTDWEKITKDKAAINLRPAQLPRSVFSADQLPSFYYRSLVEWESSEAYKRMAESGSLIKTNIPGKAQRSVGFILARLRGLVPHGWKYDWKFNNKDKYFLQASRLYAAREPKKLAGTEKRLPCREIELYEFDPREQKKAFAKKNKNIKQIESINAFDLNNESIRPIRNIGVVSKKATVDCYELGNKFLLFRAQNAQSSLQPHIHAQGKRKLVISSHGDLSANFFAFPEELKISYYCPHSAILVTPDSTANVPLHATYSTHELKRVFSHSAGQLVPRVIATTPTRTRYRSEGNKHALSQDLFLSKFGSPVHGLRFESERTSFVLNNASEGAAWAALDQDVDMLTLRHNRQPQNPTYFSHVLEQLQESGLKQQYDEIRVLACRASNASSGAVERTRVYGIGKNLETAAVRPDSSADADECFC